MSVFPFTLNPSSLSFSLTVLNFALPQLKQMKELEQEKDTLLAGLEVVERARDWYQGQIHNVTERQRQIGPSSHCTVSSGLLLLGQLWSSCEWIICGRTESVLNDTMCDFRFHSFVYFYYLTYCLYFSCACFIWSSRLTAVTWFSGTLSCDSIL